MSVEVQSVHFLPPFDKFLTVHIVIELPIGSYNETARELKYSVLVKS